ncbi:hypothetical protein D3C72_2414890 [compost metagenome]
MARRFDSSIGVLIEVIDELSRNPSIFLTGCPLECADGSRDSEHLTLPEREKQAIHLAQPIQQAGKHAIG